MYFESRLKILNSKKQIIMKSLKKTHLYGLAILGLALATSLTSCKKDEATPDPVVPSAAKLMVSSQTISQNAIWVSMANVPANGFIVVHKDNGMGGPVVPGIVSEAKWVMKGDNNDVLVKLDATSNFTDGETLWVMLHEDNGTTGVYEFDGANGFDGPFMDNGMMVMTAIDIESAALKVMDQPVVGNKIIIPEVLAAADGWLVVHNDDGSGGIVLPGIIGKTLVKKGMNMNVEVMLDASETYMAGQNLFPMLHLDNGIIGQYEFDGASAFDGPEIFGNDPFPGNVIFTSFMVQ